MTYADHLLPGAVSLWEKALQTPSRFKHKKTGLNHLLFSLLENHGKMAETLTKGLEPEIYRNKIEQKLKQNDIGEEIDPEKFLSAVIGFAKKSEKEKASERDLASVILQKSGWDLTQNAFPTDIPQGTGQDDRKNFTERKTATQTASQPGFKTRAKKQTPILDTFGRDLCQEVLEGKHKNILGRDLEIQGIMETLCRWTKRNPLLIGPAGVGKTAIIEGLAQRIVSGNVPAPLQGIRILALQPSTLISGAEMRGKLEERIKSIIEEASQDGIVLFIDEVHSIVGSGGMQQISDIGSQLKPALANGEIACIGATTDAEYHRFIESDRALERRFQPLRIQELSTGATLEILQSLAEKAQNEHKIAFSKDSLERIVLFAQQYMRNRNFPDKAIDIFEQTTAHAIISEVEKITPETIQNVSQKMIGMPINFGEQLTERLIKVKHQLINEAFCPEESADLVVDRLAITSRGLDVNPAQPNITVLVIGTPGQPAEMTASVLSKALYEDRNRLIEVDMSRFVHEIDVNWLLGAPPGYIGHDRTMKFHQEIAQQPWSVVLFKDINLSHPKAQEILAQAIRSGHILTSQERKIYLSDATLVFSINIETLENAKQIGFLPHESKQIKAEKAIEPALQKLIIPELLEVMDLWWAPAQLTEDKVKFWVNEWVFPPIYARYKNLGLQMEWKPNFIQWLTNEILANKDLNLGERLLEEEVLPKILPYLNEKGKIVIDILSDQTIQITKA